MEKDTKNIILIINSAIDNSCINLIQNIPNKNNYAFILSSLPKHEKKGLAELTKMPIYEITYDTLFKQDSIYFIDDRYNEINDFISALILIPNTHLHIIVLSEKHLSSLKIKKNDNITIIIDDAVNNINSEINADYQLSAEKIPDIFNKEMEVNQNLSGIIQNLHEKYHFNFEELQGIYKQTSKIEQEMKNLSYIIEKLPQIIVTSDKNGNIQYVNNCFIKTTGYSFDEVKHKKLSCFINDEVFLNTYDAILTKVNKGLVYNSIIRNRKKDGTSYDLDISIMTIGNKNTLLLIADNLTDKNINTSRDTLTGLGNREYFEKTLQECIQKNKDQKMSILLMDLNSFRDINDTLGHGFGDKLLKSVAHRMNDVLKSESILSRLGGDEFIFVIQNIENDNDVIHTCKEISNIIKQPFIIDDQSIYTSISIGVVNYPEHGISPHELIKKVEIAMYTAKKQEMNYIIFEESMRDSIINRFEIANSIHNAIINNEFTLYYQPIIDINTGQLTSLETLLRWHSKDKGVLFPNYFLDYIEKSGHIIEIGEQTMKDTLSKFSDLNEEIPYEFNLSFNLSAKQLLYDTLIENFMKILNETKFNPKKLMFEITEGITAQDIKHTSPIINHFCNLGISISMDDFGTGYSSLGQLKNYPINKIKIDKIFIHKAEKDNDYQLILKGIIKLAHLMNYKVVAEGVETKGQLELLKQYQCDEVQGYYVCKPLPFEELAPILQNNKGDFSSLIN